MTDKTFTYLEVEAALCIWEWINDATLVDNGPHRDEKWIALREGVGSAELRYASAVTYTPWLLSVYHLCTDIDDEIFETMSYDFEVVPMIMALCLKDDYPALDESTLPDPRAVAQSVLNIMAKRHWYEDARDASKFHWCYRELVDDHIDSFEIARQYGDMPEGAALEFGRKYGLSEPDPMTAARRMPLHLLYKPGRYTLPAEEPAQ